jgi:hypothetical protein
MAEEKDPAMLFYIDTWLVATKGMKPDCRGWYLNLILHQADKGGLPNDIVELANYADVRVDEFKKFKQVWEQVLKQKFEQNEVGLLENQTAKKILKAREQFKTKRADAGKLSYFLKYVRQHLCTDENIIQAMKKLVDLTDIDVKDKTQVEHLFKQVYEQVLKQKSELYINGNGNTNIHCIPEGGVGETSIPIGHAIISEFTKRNPEYATDLEKDLPAALGLAQNIAKWEKIPPNLTEPAIYHQILRRWGEILDFVKAHSHFSTYSITQLNKHFQSVTQSMSNGKSTSGDRKNSKSDGAAELAQRLRTQLNTAGK